MSQRSLLLLYICVLCCLNTAAQTQRRVLLEIFSTERCNQCPQAHNNIERIFGNGGDSIVMMGHHAGFYTDALTIPESVDYEWFYSPNRGLYAPAAMMNRTYDPDKTSDVFADGVPIFDGASAQRLQSAYASAISVPLSVKVELSTDYDASTRQLSITVQSSLLRRLPNAADLRLNVFLTEDSIFTATQAGKIGSYYHRHTVRQSLTGTWGESVNLNQSIERTYTTAIPEEWNAARMEVIAFVSSYDSQDRCNCQIYNTAASHFVEPTAEGISAPQADRPFVEAPYNLLGQRLKSDARGIRIQHGRIIM